MNIQQLQLEQKMNEIERKSLINGKNITVFDIASKTSEFFSDKTLGLPYFKPIVLRSYSKSDKEDYNIMFKNIEEDLKVAFKSYNFQEIDILGVKFNFDYEFIDLYNKISAFNEEIDIASELCSKKVKYKPHIITFNDLTYVNNKDLYSNNIPRTSSEIDYKTSTLRNVMISGPNSKVDIGKRAIIKISSNTRKIKTYGNIDYIANDNLTDILTIVSVGENKRHRVYVDLNLKDVVNLSRVVLSGFSMHAAKVKLYLGETEDSLFEREEFSIDNEATWIFNKRKVGYIRIEVSKFTQNDDISSIFSISNISLYDDKFENTSIFSSNVLSFKDSISSITLDSDHSVPPNTDISYYIGHEDSKNNVEWHPIKNKESIDFGLLTNVENILNYTTSSVFGKWDFDETINKRLFYIYEFPENTNYNTLDLRAGHSQWLIEKINVTDKYNKPYPNDKRVCTSDYSRSRVTDIAPLDMSMTEIRCEDEWNYFTMTTYVLCDKETMIEDRFFSYSFDKDNSGKNRETLDIAVIVNGRRIYPKNGKFSFMLNKGENLLRIMVLFGGIDVSNPSKIKWLHHNFNVLSANNDVFAGPKMRKVDYNTLYKVIDDKNLGYYAIKNVDGVDYIVTKFDPNYILTPYDPYKGKGVPEESGLYCHALDPKIYGNYRIQDVKMNNSEYIRMYIKHKYMKESTLNKIKNKKGDSSIRCRVMARLFSSDRSVSPSIRKIKVVGI